MDREQMDTVIQTVLITTQVVAVIPATPGTAVPVNASLIVRIAPLSTNVII